MAVIALTSARGAPGVTTTALALTLVWPRPVVLVEADAAAEAWRSGLAKSDTDAIAEDPGNLWLLTAAVNISNPTTTRGLATPAEDAVCTYIAADVQIKIEYSLTIGPAEHDALDLAVNCLPRS